MAFDEGFQATISDLLAMPFSIVLVGFPIFLSRDFLMGAVTVRLILRQTAHADPHRFLLGFDLERLLVGLENFSHPRDER